MVSPPIPKELLDYLRLLFPDKLPATSVPPEAFNVLIGEQRVIRHIALQFDKQNKTVLTPESSGTT